MEWVDLIKAYIEIGILGLCGILVIYIFIKEYKRRNEVDTKKQKNEESRTDGLTNKLNEVVDLLKKQNEDYRLVQEKQLEEERKRNAELVTKIIEGVTSHVPSRTENDKLTEVNKQIDEILKEILIKTKSDRACIIQYHNGGKGINKQSFLKMSMTNEKFQVDGKSFMNQFKDQFRSVLGYFVNQINDNGYCYINNVESMSSLDVGVYEFMKNRNIEAMYGYALHNDEDTTIGFILLEYNNIDDTDEKKIDNCFKEHYKLFEKQLNS